MIYYFGSVEFGHFIKEEDRRDEYTPIAIIYEVRDIKEFDDPKDAWEHYTSQGFDSYVARNASDANNKPYELVFKEEYHAR